MNEILTKSISELDYISSSIEYLHSVAIDEIDSLHERHSLLEKSNIYELFMSNDDSVEDILNKTEVDKYKYINSIKEKNYNEFQNISSTILEAILIRQVSIVEKYLVEISFFIYNKRAKNISNVIFPPNIRYDNKQKITDCIRAVESIKNNANLDIVNMKQWNKFKKIRQLRHKLAHGERGIELNNEEFKEFNKYFDRPLFKKSNNGFSRLNANYVLIKNINDLFSSFIKYIDKKIKYNLN